MAYNLQPLITILEQILDPHQTCFIHDLNEPQFKSLLEKAISLQQILEKHSLPNIEMSLERKIRDAAHKAEDIIESHMVHQMLSTNLIGWMIQWCRSFIFSWAYLQQVMQQLDSEMEQVVKLVEVEAGKKMISSRGTSSSRGTGGASLNPKNAKATSTVVGFEEDLMQLKDRLTGMQSKLEIIPIVGMGGSGKTTLARYLYEDPTIVSQFQYARAWATVSQDFNVRTILLSLLSCITGKEIDDKEVNSQSRQHEVQLLSESASWDLLRQIVFGEDDCPVELGSMGSKIASDCGGLPLAITVIGGLLSKVERSEQVWENIGENVRPAIAKSEEGEQYSNIMSLSYKHLPNYLKPCVLSMGAFPEDYEMKGSRLVCLWIAEEFVKSNRDKSLEEEAEDYLKGLVERNLVMVRRNKSNRKAMSYIIHDVLRDLCIRKAHEDNFLHVTKTENDFGVSKLRRVSCEQGYSDGMKDMYGSTELMSLVRSFRCTDYWSHAIVRSISSVSDLLRVLDIMQVWFEEFPKEILQLVNLRYIAVKCNGLPVGISRLLNLQTLIAYLGKDSVPSEIWNMSELRHLKLSGVIWIEVDFSNELAQMNKLQTVSSYLALTDSLLERGFLKTIPNIKNLGVSWRGRLEIDLSHLHKLETLRYRSLFSSDGCRFPLTVRKLTLSECTINSRMGRTVCGLPNLEVLKIIECKFEGDGTDEEEWESTQGEEFRSLQFLQLDYLKLVRWRADETNFPKLRHLLLQKCRCLEEIPSGVGEITTLELIEIKACSASSVESAKQILEVQQSDFDNYAPHLRIEE